MAETNVNAKFSGQIDSKNGAHMKLLKACVSLNVSVKSFPLRLTTKNSGNNFVETSST